MSASKLRASNSQSESSGLHASNGSGNSVVGGYHSSNFQSPPLITASALTSALWACELRWPPEVVQGILRRAVRFAPLDDAEKSQSRGERGQWTDRASEDGEEEEKGARLPPGPLDPTLPPLTDSDPTPTAVPAAALRTYLLKLRLVKATGYASSSSAAAAGQETGGGSGHVVEPWAEWFGRKQAKVAAQHKQQLSAFAAALRGATPVMPPGMPAEETVLRLREWQALVEQFERLPKGVAAAAVGLLPGDGGGVGGGGNEGEANAAAPPAQEEAEEAANTQAAARYNALLAEEAMAEASAWVRGEGGRSARADVRARMVSAIEARRRQVASSSSSSSAAAPEGEPDAVSLFQGYQRHVATWKRLKKGLSPLVGGGRQATTVPVVTAVANDDDEEEYSEDGSGSMGIGGGGAGSGGGAAQDSFALSELGDQPPSFNQWLDTFADPQGKVKKACEREVVQAKAQQLLATEAAPLVGVPLAQAPRAYRGVGEAGRGTNPPCIDDHYDNGNPDGGSNGDEDINDGGLFGLGKSKEEDEEQKGDDGPEAASEGGSVSNYHRSSGQQQHRGRGRAARGGDTVWYRPLTLTKNLLKRWLEDASKGKRDSDGKNEELKGAHVCTPVPCRHTLFF